MSTLPLHPFVMFFWISDELASVKGDGLRAWLAGEFAEAVRVNGGSYPQMSSCDQVTEDIMAQYGWEPQPGALLFRLYGHAVPPEGVATLEYEVWDPC